MHSDYKVMKPTDKPCSRCGGKGWGNWYVQMGVCFACNGTGKKHIVNIPASKAKIDAHLLEIKAEGEAAKARLEAAENGPVEGHGFGPGVRGLNELRARNANQDLERARENYRRVLAIKEFDK